MRSRFRLRHLIPAVAVALIAGLSLATFTSEGSVLGYSGFSNLTENRHTAVSFQQALPDSTATQSDASAPADETGITPDEAVEIARTVATGDVESIEIERRGDRVAYDVEIDETDVLVDASDGTVIRVETDEDDGDDWDDRDGRQSAAPSITIGEAIRTAEAATSGAFDEAELEYERGSLVYTIEIGRDEVIVDANDGSVLSVHADD